MQKQKKTTNDTPSSKNPLSNLSGSNVVLAASKGGPKLEFHWEPAIVDPQGSVTIHIDMVLRE